MSENQKLTSSRPISFLLLPAFRAARVCRGARVFQTDVNEKNDSADRLTTAGLLFPRGQEVRDFQTGSGRGNKGETE